MLALADGLYAPAGLREAREAAGLSQTEVARAMKQAGYGWHQTTVGKVEMGQRSLSLEEAVALGRIVGLEAADVIAAVSAPGDAADDALRYARVMFSVADRRLSQLEQELAAARALRDERLRIMMGLEAAAEARKAEGPSA